MSEFAVLLWLPLIVITLGLFVWLAVLIAMQHQQRRDRAKVASGELRWSRLRSVSAR